MTVYVLKLIAIITMLIDHSAWFLVLKGLIGYELYMFLRAVGRLAFPIFCFLLVNGFDKSRDRVRYVSRLMLFAVLSQIPYSVVFTQTNYNIAPDAAVSSLSFSIGLLPLLVLTLGLCGVWFFFVRRDASVLSLAALLIMGLTEWYYNGVCLLSLTHLNVFYTLALGLSAMCLIQRLRERKDRWYILALYAAGIVAVALLYGKNIDYSYMGLVLLLLLYLLRGNSYMQAAALLLWCAYAYLYAMYTPVFALGAAFSAAAPLLYNGDLGPRRKWFFYVFYPLHLTILSVLIFI